MKREKKAVAVPTARRINLCTLERCLRSRERSVLLVRVSYPVMVAAEGMIPTLTATDDAVERLNRCYAEAAELFVQNGMEIIGSGLLSDVTEAMCLRHLLVCEMIPVLDPEIKPESREANDRVLGRMRTAFQKAQGEISGEMACVLEIEITRRYGVKRKLDTSALAVERHVWRFPEGTLTVYPAIDSKL